MMIKQRRVRWMRGRLAFIGEIRLHINFCQKTLWEDGVKMGLWEIGCGKVGCNGPKVCFCEHGNEQWHHKARKFYQLSNRQLFEKGPALCSCVIISILLVFIIWSCYKWIQLVVSFHQGNGYCPYLEMSIVGSHTSLQLLNLSLCLAMYQTWFQL